MQGRCLVMYLEGCFHFGKVLSYCCNVAVSQWSQCAIARVQHRNSFLFGLSRDCSRVLRLVSGEASAVAAGVIRILTYGWEGEGPWS